MSSLSTTVCALLATLTVVSAQFDCNACGTMASNINDFSSRSAMERNGWTFGWDDNYDFLILPNPTFCPNVRHWSPILQYYLCTVPRPSSFSQPPCSACLCPSSLAAFFSFLVVPSTFQSRSRSAHSSLSCPCMSFFILVHHLYTKFCPCLRDSTCMYTSKCILLRVCDCMKEEEEDQRMREG